MFQALIKAIRLFNFDFSDRMVSVPAAFEQPAVVSK
jgi:hypothetical protein